MSELLFYAVIFLTNIIQGITGFAGTILAMPFSIRLVGYETAKPVLNVLGILAGIYVVAGNRKGVNPALLKKICVYMAVGIAAGICVKRLLSGYEAVLYAALGIFVIAIGLKGLIDSFFGTKSGEKRSRKLGENMPDLSPDAESCAPSGKMSCNAVGGAALLLSAGVIHGIFVSGGPLVVSYLSGCTKDKEEFRRTISAVWIILNSMIFASDLLAGYYTAKVIAAQFLSVPFLFGGMFVGSVLYRRMSQQLFTVLTYLLLCVAGVSLILK